MNVKDMAPELTKQVVVFRTGHLIYFDWACDALKEAGVPFFGREETSSGLRLAMPVAPSTEPGICWALLVPEPAVPDARRILSQLPFEIRTEAGIWDFQPTQKVKRGWKVYIIIVLLLGAIGFGVSLIREFHLYQ